MSFQHISSRGLDYDRCSYEQSRLSFRGPYRMPQAVDVAVVGGTETFGKFLANPFPALLEEALGRPVVNLGAPNAGIDTFLHDTIIEDVAQRARVCVVQIMGAEGLTNSFYRVHQRRNDRFTAATPNLTEAFPDLDLADCNFVRHLLERLAASDPARFSDVVAELRKTWVSRMHALIAKLAMPTVLLWMSDCAPRAAGLAQDDLGGTDPLFVTRDMVYGVAGMADGLVQVVAPKGRDSDLKDMAFSQVERPVAARMPGPDCHAQAAKALARALEPVFGALAPPSGQRKRAPGRP